jgi:hypothetical protein
MKRYFPIILLLVAWIFILPAAGSAQDNRDIQIVDAEGTGLIVNDDFASGRNIAIRNALQKAVEHVVLTLIPSKATLKESQIIKDHIYAKSDKYIRDYRIISEKQAQSVYSVNIRVKVFIASIKDDLQAIGLINIKNNRISATAISISVGGIKSCADYIKVLELMKTKVTGVNNLYLRRLEWGIAMLDLDIQGTVQELKDDLTKIEHFSVNQSGMDQNYIEVTYVK